MKLELGSGHNPRPGFTHLDINPKCPCVEIVSGIESIPLEDATVSELVAINVLEHVEWHLVRSVLREWARVVRPGGKVIIHVPDISYVSTIITSNRWQKDAGVQPYNAAEDAWEYLNHFVMSTGVPYNAHRSVFWWESLTGMLREVGFDNFTRLPAEERWLYVEGERNGE